MRLPLQPMPPMPLSGGAALKPVAANRSYQGVKPHQRKDAKVPDEPVDSFDDEDEENHSELANMLDEILDDAKSKEVSKDDEMAPSEPPEVKESLSLVERRAALFGNVANTKKNLSKPVAVKVEADTSVKESNTIESKGDIAAEEGEEADEDKDITEQQLEEYKSTSPTYDAESTAPMSSSSNYEREEQMMSPSHMDFESKKKAIFNFANKSTSRDQKWPKVGKSHFGKGTIEEACDEADAREATVKDSDEKIDACDPSEKAHTKKEQIPAHKDEAAPESSAYIDLSELEQSIKDTEKFLCPLPGGTTKAVYSPSPHLLKPSQMNLKTYSGDLFRRQSIEKGDSTRANLKEPINEDDAQINVQDADENEDTEKNIKRDDAFYLMNKLNQKYSALMETSKEISNIASPISPVQIRKPMDECSPTPHLMKPSQMNFKSTYSDNLFRRSTSATSAQSKGIGANQGQTKEKQLDFATHFSDVQSQPDFSTKFSDTVSPQKTATSSSDFSPNLTRFHYLGQNDHKNVASTSSQKLSMPDKVVRPNIDTNVDAVPQTEHVFSPLNAQMLSDMIGFTSSFSEAIVSPRNVSPTKPSPTVMSNKAAFADDSWVSKNGIAEKAMNDQSFFSDFASFTPSNFSTGTEENASQSTKGGVMDKVKFFNSPQAVSSETKFSSGQDIISSAEKTTNSQVVKKEATEENQFADFDDNWAICTVEPPNKVADTSDDDLGKGLDNILAIEDSHQEDAGSNTNNVFFGKRFNEESGTIESIKNSIGSPGTQLEETLSTIDEADEDLAAQTKIFKESLTPELSDFYSQINLMFDRKVNMLERKVKSASAENSAIKEEMCHQHQQIQGLMVQLESSRDMMQANQGLMEEIEELRAQLQDAHKKKGRIRFISGKKFNKKTLKSIWL